MIYKKVYMNLNFIKTIFSKFELNLYKNIGNWKDDK